MHLYRIIKDCTYLLLAQVNGYTLTLSQETLENPRVMLLSPRQRLIPFRDDLWTRLWELLPGGSVAEQNPSSRPEIPRFSNSTVAVKLNVSLVCYQVREHVSGTYLVLALRRFLCK